MKCVTICACTGENLADLDPVVAELCVCVEKDAVLFL
jgi:hypothetical protein